MDGQDHQEIVFQLQLCQLEEFIGDTLPLREDKFPLRGHTLEDLEILVIADETLTHIRRIRQLV